MSLYDDTFSDTSSFTKGCEEGEILPCQEEEEEEEEKEKQKKWQIRNMDFENENKVSYQGKKNLPDPLYQSQYQEKVILVQVLVP